MKRILIMGLIISIVFPITYLNAITTRIKDISRFKGSRVNQLMGYGLVAGLNGSGDNSRNLISNKTISNALKKFGFDISSSDIRSRNIAAVMVTATLPSFSRSGDRIDVNVSSIGDARDLTGGVLLQTPLFAANGRVYAAAQGKITVAGLNTRSPDDNFFIRRKVLSAKIILGAIVEISVPSEIIKNGIASIILNNADVTTANRIKNALVNKLGVIAQVIDPGMVQVSVPAQYVNDPYTFLSNIENTDINTSTRAKITISERTGTVIIGGDVRISPCAVAHNGLYLTVKGQLKQSKGRNKGNIMQAATKLQGQQSALGPDRVVTFPKATNVQNIVDALNALGATPKDVIGILTAIYEAGAMNAELVIE